jgi:hypothetical protein
MITKKSLQSFIQNLLCLDSSIDTEGTGDDFLYKVILYLTTGKVLIQGKGHEGFCDNEFPKCLSLVNEYTQTYLTQPIMTLSIQITMITLIKH